MHGFVIGWSSHVANHTKSYREAMLVVHHGQLQLQGIILAVSIMYQYIIKGITILTDRHHLQTETLLYQTELVVLAEHEFLAVAYIDTVLLSTFLGIDGIVAAIVEDDAVLQDLAHSSTFMVVGSLQDLHCLGIIGSHRTGKELTASTEAELSRTERIFYCTIRR